MRLPTRLTTRLPTRLTTTAGIAAITAIAFGTVTSAALAGTHHRRGHDGYQRPAAGYVYTDLNTATENTIAGYARSENGTLTPLPGSPFAAGGFGVGAGNTSQDSIVTGYDGRYVLAVDSGSNQISVLRVGQNGNLTLVGSPVSSGGADPVAIGVNGSLVYVANAAPGSADIAGFRLGGGGTLTPIAGSTVSLGATAQPDDVVFNRTGTNLIVPDVALSQIYSYSVGSNGLLTAAPDSPIAGQGLGQFGSDFDPWNPSRLFVSNAHNGAGLGTVSAYNVATDGSFTAIGGSPFADHETAPCWTAVSPDGRYLFVVNAATPSISTYQINADGSLTLMGAFPFRTGSSTHPLDVTVAADEYVYVKGASTIATFRILDGGFLREIPSSPAALPVNATASGITSTN